MPQTQYCNCLLELVHTPLETYSEVYLTLYNDRTYLTVWQKISLIKDKLESNFLKVNTLPVSWIICWQGGLLTPFLWVTKIQKKVITHTLLIFNWSGGCLSRSIWVVPFIQMNDMVQATTKIDAQNVKNPMEPIIIGLLPYRCVCIVIILIFFTLIDCSIFT